VGKYDDLKITTDLYSIVNARDEARVRERSDVAVQLCHNLLMDELTEIGATFFSGRFFLKKGYRVRPFRGRESIISDAESLIYSWLLEYQIGNGTSYYYDSLLVELRPTEALGFALFICSDFRGPGIDKDIADKVIMRFREFLDELDLRIVSELEAVKGIMTTHVMAPMKSKSLLASVGKFLTVDL
jgi:hypothetical protein